MIPSAIRNSATFPLSSARNLGFFFPDIYNDDKTVGYVRGTYT